MTALFVIIPYYFPLSPTISHYFPLPRPPAIAPYRLNAVQAGTGFRSCQSTSQTFSPCPYLQRTRDRKQKISSDISPPASEYLFPGRDTTHPFPRAGNSDLVNLAFVLHTHAYLHLYFGGKGRLSLDFTSR
jgi:hypothetical protein